MSYTITAFESTEYDRYKSFMARLGQDNSVSTDARRRWWCFDNPHGGLLAAAHTESELAATLYLSGKRLALGLKEPALAFEIGEGWTGENHRRRGLFTQLITYCTQHALSRGAAIVYGTPNHQSTPGFRNLGGWEILESPPNPLYLGASIPGMIRHYFSRAFPRGSTAAAKSTPSTAEVSLDTYIGHTRGFSRVNAGTPEYLKWRLGDAARPYRFFRREDGAISFWCATRGGRLGPYPVVVVAEAFVDGRRADAPTLAKLLRPVISAAYAPSSFVGFHFHAMASTRPGRISLWSRRTLMHRVLPFCIRASTPTQLEAFARAATGFQLSDCDIG